MAVVSIVSARRRVLKTFALTMATSAIRLASAGAKPAAAALQSVLTPPPATHLYALIKRLPRAPPPPHFKNLPMIFYHPKQLDYEALTEVLSHRPSPTPAL